VPDALTFPVGDHATAAECLRGLAHETDRRGLQSAEGRRRAQEAFSLTGMVDGIEDVYRHGAESP
jgi:hypothetical protein